MDKSAVEEGGVCVAQRNCSTPGSSGGRRAPVHLSEETPPPPGKPADNMPPARVDHTTAVNAESSGVVSDCVRQGSTAAAAQNGKADSTDSPSGRKGRRVRFPEGNLVTRAVDPPNPWINAKETCTDELCAAYQAGCAQLNVRPSQNIIQQLQRVKDFTVRAESLNLQGEKLDLKAVETLEEVFKRVQFNTIDVEGTGMDDEAAMALCEMIEFYQSTCKLIYAGNRSIGFRGWQAASRLLRRTPCLHTFDARNTCWTEHSMPVMSRALRVDTSVTALHLEACNLSGRPHFLLMSALRTNSTLRELFLADNRLMPSDAIHIGGMLRHNSGLKLLDLRNNNIQDTGLSHISNGLAAQLKEGLSTLVLWNNHISHNGVAHLGKALVKTTNLETLNLGQNNLGTDGIHLLKDGLMKNKSLMRLGMYSCRLSDEGAVALAEYLADNCNLMRLDLRENDIRTGGMMALSLSLRVNTILLRLDLDKDVKKESLKGYEELQQSLLSEMCTHLARNRQILEQRQKEEEELAKNATLMQNNMQDNHQTRLDAGSGGDSNDPSASDGGETVVRDTRDPLMGVESLQEELVVIGYRPTCGARSSKGGEDAKEDPQTTVQSSHQENVPDLFAAMETSQKHSSEAKATQVPSSLSASIRDSTGEVQSVLTSTPSSIPSSCASGMPSTMSSVPIESSNNSQRPTSLEDAKGYPLSGIRINDSIHLLPRGTRSGSITRVELPADESKLLHSDSIDVESPTSPSTHRTMDLPCSSESVIQESEAIASGDKTTSGSPLKEIGDVDRVLSPDTQPFGRGMPLNIDGRIGNGLLSGISDSLFLPHLQSPDQSDPEVLPSPDLEKDVDDILATAHAI